MADIEIRGISETQQAIYAFSRKLGDRVIRLSLRSGANYFKQKLMPVIPVKSGRLKRSVVIKNSRRDRPNRNGKIGIYLNFRTKGGRNDPRSAIYAGWVERGYNKGSKKIGSREAINRGMTTENADLFQRLATGRKKTYRDSGKKRIDGQFFVKRAFDASKESIRRLIITDIEKAGEKLIREIRGNS